MNNYKNVTFLCGPICSGKTTLAKLFTSSHKIIEVSGIVKDIMKTSHRPALQKTGYLDKKIISHIKMAIDLYPFEEFLIVGPRQLSIIKAFDQASCVWINVPVEVRFERFIARDKDENKTREYFDKICAKDDELGLSHIQNYLINHHEKIRTRIHLSDELPGSSSSGELVPSDISALTGRSGLR